MAYSGYPKRVTASVNVSHERRNRGNFVSHERPFPLSFDMELRFVRALRIIVFDAATKVAILKPFLMSFGAARTIALNTIRDQHLRDLPLAKGFSR